MTVKERYNGIIKYFTTHVPVAETELRYNNSFELIVAVILSAQCTDKRINQVTPKLFEAFPTVEALAASNVETVFNYIKSVSYPNNKAKHLVNMANMLMNDFGGKIPNQINELVKLPGVGRKTANVVASVIFEQPAMAVDTHVFRVSNRLGLTKAKTALQSELQLIKYIPKEYVATAHHWLILHGRYICVARNPKCEICPLTEWCHFFKTKVINQNYPHSLSKKTNMIKKETLLNATKNNPKNSIGLIAKGNANKLPVKKNSEQKFIPHTTALKAGDKAPYFQATDQNGKIVSLTDYKGKKIILYFYPKDNTPTCTLEACSLRDEHKYLAKKNFVVLGVSADDEKMHRKFAEKFDLPFSLLADVNREIIEAYNVWGTKRFMGKIYDGIIRTTFIINEKGIIENVITDVKSKEHAKQILAL